MIISKSRKDLKPQLMQPKARGIKDPYCLIEDLEQIILVVKPGKNGSEFNKTVGYFSSYAGVNIHQCLYGQGILVMQRNDEAGEVKEFKVVTLNSGRQVAVPTGWAMCLINVGRSFLVTVCGSGIEDKDLDSKAILDKQGLAYYVVEKKGEIGFEPNPHYSVRPQISTE